MMIRIATQQKMAEVCQKEWENICKNDQAFISSFSKGKEEVGHTIATLVKDKTCSILELEFPNLIKYELYGKKATKDKRGERQKRAYGDCYIYDNLMFNAMNIKTVIDFINDEKDMDISNGDDKNYDMGSKNKKKNGSPNGVSFDRFCTSIANKESDSYNFIMITFDIKDNRPKPRVYMADLIDLIKLNFVYFAAGTGQILIQNTKFYPFMHELNTNILPEQNIDQFDLKKSLILIYKNGIETLIENRNKALNKVINLFDQNNIEKIDQSKMSFGI